MNHHFKLLCCFVALALVAATPLFAAQERDRNSAEFSRSYQINYLDVRETEVLVWDLCPTDRDTICRVTSCEPVEDFINLEVDADARTHAKIARALYERDLPAPTLGFQITLVRAAKSGSSELDDLPRGAETAIEDLKALLPYTSFSVLDVGLVRANRGARTTLAAEGHMYEISFDIERGLKGAKDAEIRRFFVVRYENLDSTVGPRTNLLSTSFSLDVGETVVVGTSKHDGGDEAIVVLVTATDV